MQFFTGGARDVTVLYFAYGSCMCPDELSRDVSVYTVVGAATVRGFRLGFTRFSRNRKGGVADLVPDIDSETEGVLYRLPRAMLPALDEREGAPDHYRRDFIAVRTVDGKLHDRVLTYVVVRKEPGELVPHPDYAQALLNGARTYLSEAYVENLIRFIDHLIAAQAESRASRSGHREHTSGRSRRHRGGVRRGR